MMDLLYLIKLEWKKFKSNTVIVLLLGLYTVLMPIAIFVMENFESGPGLPTKDTFFTFPQVWDYQGYSGSWFSFLFLGFIGVLIITSEVSYKTMRQNIITGLTRTQFFMGKIYVLLLVSLYATLLYFVSTVLIGTFYPAEPDFANFMDGHNWATARYFLMTFGYLSFGLFLGLLFRKSGLAIFLYLSYIVFLEPLLRWGVHWRLFEHSSMKYYPMNAFEDLMPMPFYKVIENFNPVTEFNLLMNYQEAAIVSVISVIVFIFLAYRFLLKRDM
jgi:ABC-type transport system involved in multi-copper enzyme maturation permease subunit